MSLQFKAFQNLIKQYCIEHTDVQHSVDGLVSFVRMESDDAENGIAQNGGKVIVIVDDFHGRSIGDPDDRRYVQTARLIFLAYADTNNGDKPGAIEDAQDLAEQVMLQFEARMWEDYQQDGCGAMRDMLWELTSYDPMEGPMLQNHYGWMMTINFRNIKPGYDPAKWNIE